MQMTVDRIFKIVSDSGVPDRNVKSTLAKVCGISPQAVHDWREGKTKNIGHDHLRAIARRYKVSIDWLLTGKGAPGDTSIKAPDYEDSIFATLSNEDRLGVIEQILPTLDDAGRARALRILMKLG